MRLNCKNSSLFVVFLVVVVCENGGVDFFDGVFGDDVVCGIVDVSVVFDMDVGGNMDLDVGVLSDVDVFCEFDLFFWICVGWCCGDVMNNCGEFVECGMCVMLIECIDDGFCFCLMCDMDYELGEIYYGLNDWIEY